MFRTRVRQVWRRSGSPPPGPQLYADQFLANLQAKTQSRSAQALAAVGVMEPLRTALDSADAWGYRSAVVQDIQGILGSLPPGVGHTDGRVLGRVRTGFGPPGLIIWPEAPATGPEIPLPRALAPVACPGVPGAGGPRAPGVTFSPPTTLQLRPVQDVPVELRRCRRAPAILTIPVRGRCLTYDSAMFILDTTDAAGLFSFSALPEGAYEIEPDTTAGRYVPIAVEPLLVFLKGRADSTRVLFLMNPY